MSKIRIEDLIDELKLLERYLYDLESWFSDGWNACIEEIER